MAEFQKFNVLAKLGYHVDRHNMARILAALYGPDFYASVFGNNVMAEIGVEEVGVIDEALGKLKKALVVEEYQIVGFDPDADDGTLPDDYEDMGCGCA